MIIDNSATLLILIGSTISVVKRISKISASTNASASVKVAQVRPYAPAYSCNFAISTVFDALKCGRTLILFFRDLFKFLMFCSKISRFTIKAGVSI